MTEVALPLALLVIGLLVGWILRHHKARAQRELGSLVLEDAHQEAQAILRETRLAAQDEIFKARARFDRETQERRGELNESEKRLLQREATLDRKAEVLERKLEEVRVTERQIVDREKQLHRLQDELDELKRLSVQELSRFARLTPEEARAELMRRLEDDTRTEAENLTRRILENARRTAETEAKRVITIAIERCAADHVQSCTTCIVTLPSDDMKGRIIGREGRNIRSFEAATGINVLIDDTPQTVVLSGFDPIRREAARQTMERLIADGRINPARIEEEARKVQDELKQSLGKAGEDAVFALGLRRVAPEILDLLGRLRFRHSFSQNVLDHSIEVARLAGLMASELGLDEQIAKRVGLFHDIGKAVDHEVQGSHAVIGAQLLKRYGEPEEICQGVACHHHEVEPVTLYGELTSAADAVSASRPGARSESIEMYLERLEKLESLALGFTGVEKCYALQAGREIRVLVEPTQVSDGEAGYLAREIGRKIEQDLQYPGQIKVTVVRETRCTEYAK